MSRTPFHPGRLLARASAAVTVAVTSLLVCGAVAQAAVVDMNAYEPGAGTPSQFYGVAFTQTTTTRPPAKSVAASCTDPVLAGDLAYNGAAGSLTPGSLCYQGGDVMRNNETFALTWDPGRAYWQTTKNYVQQFLRNVADASHQLASPYAVTGQYSGTNAFPHDTTVGPANNISTFGGGCVDYGTTGGSQCTFGTPGAGHAYHVTNAPSCQRTTPAQLGVNQFHEFPDGSYGNAPNTDCITDAEIQGEVAAEYTGEFVSHLQPTNTPLIVVLTPPGVVDCLDAAGHICSANATTTAPDSSAATLFCSYHGEVSVPTSNGTVNVPYMVQPWTVGWHTPTGCDDKGLPVIPDPVAVDELAGDAGQRLVSPLSQSHIASITDPFFTGWISNDGSEVNDNGCTSEPNDLDKVQISNTLYWLQREFNNGGYIISDPNALLCTPLVNLSANFVAPSAVNQGDVVQFDGTTTVSTLAIPNAGYTWDFGDGTHATGPSANKVYATGGIYTVTLNVKDRGGNTASFQQTVQVLGPNGLPVAGTPVPPQQGGPIPAQGGPTATPLPIPTSGEPTAAPTSGTPAGPGTPGTPAIPTVAVKPLSVTLQLLPQSMRQLLTNGMALRVNANEAADGVVAMAITRAAARIVGLKTGPAAQVVIARGTVGGKITAGTVVLHLRLATKTARRLSCIKHLKLMVTLSLVNRTGQRVTYDVAGRY